MTRYLPAFFAAATLLAHHSMSATYDRATENEYQATVTRVAWMNPHATFFAMVTGPDGKTAEWTFEMGPPNTLLREGWAKDSIRPGQVLLVRASPAKDGSPLGAVERIKWQDGTIRENRSVWAEWVGPDKK